MRRCSAPSSQVFLHIQIKYDQEFPTLAYKHYSSIPQQYQKILRDPQVRKTLLSSLQEAFRQGGAGPAWDLYLYTNPWDFAIKDIDIETFIWHGMKDGSVPLQMGQKHATLIANAHFKVFENEGHFSLPIKHMKEILTAIMK